MALALVDSRLATGKLRYRLWISGWNAPLTFIVYNKTGDDSFRNEFTSIQASEVPEPTALVLLSLALAGLRLTKRC